MKQTSDILIVSRSEVESILAEQESVIINLIKQAYMAHDDGTTSLPHSTFLRFPSQPRDRIIGLPAYINGDQPVAGIKWVASFPENLEKGLDRASATIIVNDATTGRPIGFVEGSAINAARTAASAALGAIYISGDKIFDSFAQIGCGPISREILKFIMHNFNDIQSLYLYDIDQKRAEQYANIVAASYPSLKISVCETLLQATRASQLVALATTAATPYIDSVEYFQPGATILNISLRDLSPSIILGALNIVDDVDHVNREQTSVHLASKEVGNVDFVFANIGYVLKNPACVQPFETDSRLRIYSPFGLGILDIATAQYILQQAETRGIGTRISGFLN